LRGASVRGLQQQFLELSAELIAVTAAETDACIERAFSTLGTRLGLDLVAVVQLDSAVNYCAPAASSRGMFANPRMSAERSERLLAWLTIQARREVAVVFPAPEWRAASVVPDLECLLESGGWCSLVSVPLAVSGQSFGFVVFTTAGLRDWPAWLLVRLQSFAELAASAISRKIKEQQLDSSMLFEHLLFSVSASFIRMSVADIDAELKSALQRTVIFLGLDAGMIMALEPGANSLVRTHDYCDRGIPALPSRVDGLSELTLSSLRNGDPIVVSSVGDLPPEAVGERDSMTAASIGSLVAIPLNPARHPGGFVSFMVSSREVVWTDAVVQRLRLLGEMFASALARQALEGITRNLLEFESLVATMATYFAGLDSAQVEGALEPALEEIRAFFDADQCGIFEIFSAGREAYLRFRVFHPGVTPAPTEPNYADHFPYTVEQTCVRGLPCVMNDLGDLPVDAVVDRASKVAFGVQSNIDMPVAVNGKVRFVLTLAFTRRQWRWSDEYVARIRLLALTLVNSLVRARAEMGLRASEQRFRQVVDAAPNGVMMIEPTGQIVMVNRQLEAIFGYPREELVGRATRTLLPDWQLADRHECLGQEAIEPAMSELPLRQELSGRRQDGVEITVEAGLCPIEIDGAGYLLANIADITGRKRTERALQAARDGLGEAQRIARLGSFEWNVADGKWTGSEEARRIYGSAPDDIETPMRYIHPDDQIMVLSNIERVLEMREPRYEFECRIIRPDFSAATVRARGEVTYAPGGGSAIRVVGTVQDVSEARAADHEVRRLRGQLYHADRVVRASALTASLAHELNQPLAAILSNAQAGLRLMAHGVPEPAEIHEILSDIVRDDKRAAAVINGLRAMLRQKETDRVALDVAAAIDDLLNLLRGEIVAASVELVTEFESGCVVSADRTQFEQVMLNLVLNAIEAMRDPVVLERRLAITARATRDGMVLITIADSGPGIPAAKADTVFDVFWTTKEEGMGMGLAVCRNIVESHGGRIWLESAPEGGGAVFSIELPAATPGLGHF
jgi:PAS domain S-box-containing protein